MHPNTLKLFYGELGQNSQPCIYNLFQLILIEILLFLADNNFRELPWGALDDVVMGGVSESTFQIDPKGGENGGPTGLFKGLLLSNSRNFSYVILSC